MTAATEQTLAELLATAQAMNANLVKIAGSLKSGAGGGAGSAGATAASSMAAAAGVATKSFSALSAVVTGVQAAFNLLSNAVAGVTGIIGRVIGGFNNLLLGLGSVMSGITSFAQGLADGSVKMSGLLDSLSNALKELPVLGGLIGGVVQAMSYLMGTLEKSYEAFKTMSQVGVTFGGDLQRLRLSAQQANMSVDAFASRLSQNGALLATAGADTEKGAQIMSGAFAAVVGPNSSVFRNLAGLGYSAEHAADLTTLFMQGMGTLNREQLKDQNFISRGVRDLAVEMSSLAELTGMQKKQLEEELAKAQREANWQNFIAGVTDPKEVARINAALATAMATGGKGLVDQVKTGISDGIFTPITKESRNLYIGSKGASEQAARAIAENARTGSAESAKAQNAAVYNMAKKGQELTDQLGATGRIMAVQGQSIQSQEQLAFQTRLKGIKSEEEFNSLVSEIHQKNLAAGNTQAGGVGAINQRLVSLGNTLLGIIDKLAGPFIGPLDSIIGSMDGITSVLINTVQPYLTDFSNWLKPYMDKLTNIKTFDDFTRIFKDMWADIKAYMRPAITNLWTEVKPFLVDALKGTFSSIFEALKSAIVPDWMSKFNTKGAIGGAAVGAMIGGPVGAMIGGLVGGFVGGAISSKDAEAAKAIEGGAGIAQSGTTATTPTPLPPLMGPVGGDVERALATIRAKESGGNYQAKAKGSTASGAYQFIDSTWQSLTKKFGVGGEYKSAGAAPKEVQDAVARAYVQDIMKRAGGDISKVPVEWYTGNLQGKMSASALAVNNGMTPDQYQAKWMKEYNKGSGGADAPTIPPVASTTPPAAATTPQPTKVTSSQSASEDAGSALNTHIGRLITVSAQIAENTARTVAAINSLNGNAFKRVS